jgi:hypothetical protein
VSYVLRLAAEAKRGLAALPAVVQEQALDLIDEFAVDPPTSSRSESVIPEEVLDFVAESKNKKYYVFIVVRLDHRIKTVRVDAVGHVIRS